PPPLPRILPPHPSSTLFPYTTLFRSSVGIARDAVIAWRLAHGGPDAEGFAWSLPVVAETWDGWLNDVDGFHVKPEHIADAIENRSEEHTSELQSPYDLVCRLLLEKKK